MSKKFLKTDIKINGVKSLSKFLDQLPKRALKKALRQAVNAGATPIARDARKLAPKLTGTLKKSIKKKVKVYPNGNAVAIIGADRSVTSTSTKTKTGRNVPANYIHLVERGVAPHAQPNHWYFKRAGHPGTKVSQRFLETAFNRNKGQAQKIMENKMEEVLIKEAAKLK